MSRLRRQARSADAALVLAALTAAAVGRVMQAGGGHPVVAWTTLVHTGLLAATALGVARARRAYRAEARADTRRRADEDRLRLARDLHDALGHHLSLINVQAGAALHRPDAARSTEALAVIRATSGETLHELRSTLAALRHGAPAAAPGLAHLGALIGTTGRSGLAVRAEVAETGTLAPEVDAAAYRIVQEALTNVARHARATSAVVRVRPEGGGVVIEVEDDGCGAASGPDHRGPAGSGIPGMHERARAVGGSLTTGPAPGGGFRVRARLPRRPGRTATGIPR